MDPLFPPFPLQQLFLSDPMDPSSIGRKFKLAIFTGSRSSFMTLGMTMAELPTSPAETDFLVGEVGESDLAIPPEPGQAV